MECKDGRIDILVLAVSLNNTNIHTLQMQHFLTYTIPIPPVPPMCAVLTCQDRNNGRSISCRTNYYSMFITWPNHSLL